MYMKMSNRNIRSSRRNFLPSATKKEIKESIWGDQYGGKWLFHKDLKRNTMDKKWAIFESDQWSDNWRIMYATNIDKWPEPDDNITIRSSKKEITLNVVRSYPTRRICRTYIVTIQTINDIEE